MLREPRGILEEYGEMAGVLLSSGWEAQERLGSLGGAWVSWGCQYLAFAPGFSEVAVGVLVFLYLLSRICPKCACMQLFLVPHCSRRYLSRCKHCSKGSLVPGPRSQPVSLRCSGPTPLCGFHSLISFSPLALQTGGA